MNRSITMTMTRSPNRPEELGYPDPRLLGKLESFSLNPQGNWGTSYSQMKTRWVFCWSWCRLMFTGFQMDGVDSDKPGNSKLSIYDSWNKEKKISPGLTLEIRSSLGVNSNLWPNIIVLWLSPTGVSPGFGPLVLVRSRFEFPRRLPCDLETKGSGWEYYLPPVQ